MAFITTSLPQLDSFRRRTWNVGRLLVPGTTFSNASMDRMIASGYPWAADCGGFKKVDYRRYLLMLSKLPADAGCRFVVPPDKIGNAVETLRLFHAWHELIRTDLDLPIAYVLQDGLEEASPPWELLDAVFIGGSTEFKLGPLVRTTVAEAKILGKWVHMGRVSSLERGNYARSIGCDSFDGSRFGRFPTELEDTLISILEP